MSNFLQGRIEARDGQWLFVCDSSAGQGQVDVTFLHSTPLPELWGGGAPVTLGVDPDRVRVSREPMERPEAGAVASIASADGPEGRALPGYGEESEFHGHAPDSCRSPEAPRMGLWGRVLSLGEGRVAAEVCGARWLGGAAGTMPGAGLRAGEACWVEWDRDAMEWYDASGAAISVRPMPPMLKEPQGDRDVGTRGLVKASLHGPEADSGAERGAGQSS